MMYQPIHTGVINNNVVTTASTSSGPAINEPKTNRGPRGGIYDPFPLKFHRVLDEIKQEGMESIVSWVSHGRAFKIHNPSMFVTEVMPRFFGQSKYTSFQRQLNLYGFCRCNRGPDAGAYYHPYFLRGNRSLTRHILRTKIKGAANKAIMNRQDSDPDFYAMAPLNDSNESSFSNSSSFSNNSSSSSTSAEYSSSDVSAVDYSSSMSASSVMIYELAFVCTTLCNLRKDTNV